MEILSLTEPLVLPNLLQRLHVLFMVHNCYDTCVWHSAMMFEFHHVFI